MTDKMKKTIRGKLIAIIVAMLITVPFFKFSVEYIRWFVIAYLTYIFITEIMTIKKLYIKISVIVFLYAVAVINAVNTTEKTDDKIEFSLIIMTVILIWCIIENSLKALKKDRRQENRTNEWHKKYNRKRI